MHTNLWRTPGSALFVNCAHRKYIFLVRKVNIVNFFDMVSNVPFTQVDSAIAIVDETSRFQIGGNPGRSLTLASISTDLHMLHLSIFYKYYKKICISDPNQYVSEITGEEYWILIWKRAVIVRGTENALYTRVETGCKRYQHIIRGRVILRKHKSLVVRERRSLAGIRCIAPDTFTGLEVFLFHLPNNCSSGFKYHHQFIKCKQTVLISRQ